MSDQDLIRRGDILAGLMKAWGDPYATFSLEQVVSALPAVDVAGVRVMRGGGIIVADGVGYDLRDCTERAYALAINSGSTNPAFDSPPWFFTGSPYADQIKSLGATVVDIPENFEPENVPDLGKVWRSRETIWDTYCKTTPLIDTPADPVTLARALEVPEVARLVEAADKARIILAEYEPHPLPVLAELLAALAALKGGDA